MLVSDTAGFDTEKVMEVVAPNYIGRLPSGENISLNPDINFTDVSGNPISNTLGYVFYTLALGNEKASNNVLSAPSIEAMLKDGKLSDTL